MLRSRPRPATVVALATTAVTVTALGTPSVAFAEGGELGGSGKSTEPGQSAFRQPDKSFAAYVGKNRSSNGHTMLGGFGHEPSSHWMEVVPAQDHPKGSEITVGSTGEADMPGKLTKIPQARHTYRYLTSNYSEFTGMPAPLTNGGLNEKGVAARDVWSNSRKELLDMTPKDQTGPQYSDLSRIAMERAGSAREAVEILGDLIDTHGYTTYGGNSHLFADAEEGWVLVEYAGGKGLWAAERLGPDDIRVSYPGYIKEFPTDAVEGKNPDFMGSENLVSFAEKKGWYDPSEDKTFNLQKVYQEPFPTKSFPVGKNADPKDPAPYRNPVSLEKEFAGLGKVRLQDMMRIVRDPRWSDDRSGYGQVAELDPGLPDPRLATLWTAPTAAVTAPYIPVAIGTGELPVEYTQHRYMTAGASAEYLDPEYAEQEATESATQTFKRLMYATCARPRLYLGDVTAAFEGFEAQQIKDWKQVQGKAEAAPDRTADILTGYTNEQALDGLRLGNHLLDDILSRSRAAKGGLREPGTGETPDDDGSTASARSRPMGLRGPESARDRMNCDVGGGWADGSSVDRAGHYGDPSEVPDYSDARVSGRTAASAERSGDSSWRNWAPWSIAAVSLLVAAGTVWHSRRRAGSP
ncbi:peptidase U34 [Streptomyces abyssalis]|uniref:Peptidase U34 n=1 Tax=Streptomyces abyssalis TaxID=933944 RepID=A0A1E7JQF0_9ACTN|nr:C69 family dipeptidase [Streptomyces abyssalis]OEU90486.1 peptidase U34 [Streptomyces abyssalis]OEU95223.1 peptidase U34 [Streptomyces abyssalis]